jgi:glycosyltransferase involved in cell wall biosynthesis
MYNHQQILALSFRHRPENVIIESGLLIMKKTSISVVIPAYNSEATLGETLASIAQQSAPVDQIIVVDDGSTDSTFDIASGFNQNLVVLSTKNNGQGEARAYGIAQSSTQYIALCDSDDIWETYHIERRLALLSGYPDADFTFSDCFSFGGFANTGQTLLKEAPTAWIDKWAIQDASKFYRLNDPYQALLEFNPAYVSGMVFRRESYDRMGGFQKRYSRWIGEDSEFTRRFASLDDCVFVGDTLPTWGYRRHSSNYSAVQWKNIKAKADILDEHLRLGVVPPPYVGVTCDERDATRGAAFDQACWEKASDHVASLFSELPPAQRTAKRRAKALFAKAGLFF